jgi:hypothetical protein
VDDKPSPNSRSEEGGGHDSTDMYLRNSLCMRIRAILRETLLRQNLEQALNDALRRSGSDPRRAAVAGALVKK